MLTQAAMLLPMFLQIFTLPLGRNFGCEKQLSIKGLKYFTVVLFNNRKIDMPCPPGKLYRHSLCRCDYPPEEVTIISSKNTTPANQRTESTYGPTQDTERPSIAPSTNPHNTAQDTGHTSRVPQITTHNSGTAQDTKPTSKVPPTTVRNDGTVQNTDRTSKAPKTTLRDDTTVDDKTTVSSVITTSSAKPPGCRPFGKGFEEYIDGLGWVYSDCFGGKKFSQEHCACVTPPFECNYVPYDDGYLENIPGIGDVYSDCPRDHKFNPAECKCTPGGRNTQSGNNGGNSIAGCPYKASGSGYLEHISGVGDVFGDCPPDHTFDEHTCNCVTGGAAVVDNKIPSTGYVTPFPITNKACKLTATGDGYTEHISGVGDVYTDCAAGQTFSIVECACVQKGREHVVTVPTPSPSVNTDKAACKYKSSGDGYTEHIAGLGDAYNDCPKDHTFNELVCKCIQKGVVVAVTPAPSLPSNTQKPEHTVTNPSKADCKFKSSGDGYTEHIAGLGDAYNDCPKDHTFNELVCKCVKKGTVVAVTQAPEPPANTQTPAPAVTNPNCGFIPSGTGYLENIPGIGDVYNDCPPSEAFDVKSCSCTAAISRK